MEEHRKPLWLIPFVLAFKLFAMLGKICIGILIFGLKTIFDLTMNILLAFDFLGIFTPLFEDNTKKENIKSK